MIFSDEIISSIRKQSVEMEKEGALTPQILDFIYEHKLFKLFVPEELGGKMTPLPDALRIFEQASWIDGSFGWLITIGSGGGFFSSSMEPSVSRKLFSGPKAVVAGSGHPSGTAKKVDGGFRVSGQWKYCSGSNHATLFTANCVIESDQESANPIIRSFIFLPNQVTVMKDWKAFGLKATESHSITVDNVFVSEEMTFDISHSLVHYSDPIFHFPFLQFAEASFAAVSIGICRHFLDEAHSILIQKKQAWEAQGNQRFSFVMGIVNREEQLLTESINGFYRAMEKSWENHIHHKHLTEAEWQHISRQCKETAKVALHCAQTVFSFMGIGAIMEDTLINQTWRDLQTVCHHSLLVPFYD